MNRWKFPVFAIQSDRLAYSALRTCCAILQCKGNVLNAMNEQELQKRLELLRTEHRDLDAAIAALTEAGQKSGFGDQLQIARLKKRKLRLKDQITIIEDTLLPDIIA